MGDPRKTRRKFDKPSHPWQKTRIEEENAISEEYGFHNKSEIWKMETILRKFKDQVKALASRIDEQSKLEEKQLVEKLISLGLMKQHDPLDVVLGLTNKNVFERRLQTLLVRKGLARSMKQARQFITHGHVMVDKKKITFPSYMVSLKEESLIEFVPGSTLSNPDHPERVIEAPAKEKKADKKDDKKEEAPLVFSEEEIKELEEKGTVEKKAEPKAVEEHKPAKHEKKKKE
ncbi:30S ribosomal protein S4 [Candidatus Woesearchaeota archaeon]|nr:30S ribosomal protein S4 [Candidatus Woesearchaeota archaeon]